jgi:hypothetical protein
VILFWVKQKRVLPPDYSRLVQVKSTAGDTQWAQRFKDGQNPASWDALTVTRIFRKSVYTSRSSG